MALFFDYLAKEYDPANIDGHMFAMWFDAPHCVPLVCTSPVAEDGYGTVTVDGIEISHGSCVKLDLSPFPFYFVPVGEVAREFGRSYTVRLQGFRAKNGTKFPSYTFRVRTRTRGEKSERYAERDRAAKAVSDEGIVLLQNHGVLPLKEQTPLALLGEAEDFRISAIGAGKLNPRWHLPLREALEEHFVLTDEADTALFVLSRGSGEGRDNKAEPGGYYLTDKEKQALQSARRQYKNLILVLSTGYPIAMAELLALGADAVLWTGFSGQSGSESLCGILSGAVNPSGALADTWPLDYYDSPSAHNFINRTSADEQYSDDGKVHGAHVYYDEGLKVCYRYFDSQNKPVAFPFGHGLSYTSFALRGETSFADKTLHVDVTVKNTGERAGKKTVLVYVALPQGRLQKPRRVLAGFAKSKLLAPGEEGRIELPIPAKDFASFDTETSAFVLEAGNYGVQLGGSLAEAEAIGSFTLEEELEIEQSFSVCAPVETVGIGDGFTARSEVVPSENRIAVRANVSYKQEAELPPYQGKALTLNEIKENPALLDSFVSQLTEEELVNLVVCNGSCFGRRQSGAAGRLWHSVKRGIPELFMSDGNCCVNLHTPTTAFPSSNLLAGTFNKDLAYRVGAVLAEDSKELGIAINLGPGGNLHRNLLCGRHPEYFSEDPILSGTMMAAQARGLEEHGVGATYKHLFANNMEFERKAAHSLVGEQTVRELYLRVFDKALSLYRPSCIMTSYNPVNGAYPSENSELLQKLLREQWGFGGFVMTDWGGCDRADAVRSLRAGTNLLTPGDKKLKAKVRRALRRGELDKATLQARAKDTLRVLLKVWEA